VSGWGRPRSDFNHGWLKNRLIVALSKAQNVLSGAVEDEFIWEDLLCLLAEWGERRLDAERILLEYRARVSPKGFVYVKPLSGLDSATRDWLAQLIESRWEEREEPGKRLAKAEEALRVFDEKAAITFRTLSESREGNRSDFSEIVEIFRVAARKLADAFSQLICAH
jgi:hypothetical protein